MTLEENISKYKKIVAAHTDKLSEEAIAKTVRLIVMADVLHRADAEHENYEHLSLCTVAGCGLFGIKNVWYGGEVDMRNVSDVMQMRIMCDVLTILLKGNQPLAMCFSMDVVKAIGGSVKTTVETYLEFDECEKILDSYASSAFDEELRPVFEQTSAYLKRLKALQPVVNKSGSILHKSCVSGIWLPKEFTSSGYDVTTVEPRGFTTLEAGKVACVMAYNMSFIMDVLVRVIAREDKGDVARMSFFMRLREIVQLSPECFPVATGLPDRVREPVYVPRHFLTNRAWESTYMGYFNHMQKISSDSIGSVFKAIELWYSSGVKEVN